MRTIDSQPEPVAYSEWRARSRNDINYGYDLIPGELRSELKAALIAQQRGICAYTGIGINISHSHIEHLIPQAHCIQGHGDVAYNNMVACFPGPKDGYAPFGAVFKANWPNPQEQHLLVSPRSQGCEMRFNFSISGAVSVNLNDEAAKATVEKLGLGNSRLEGMRNEAIRATLQWHGRSLPLLNISEARKRLAKLEQAELTDGGNLEPFCFSLKQGLRKHIARLEYVRESIRRQRGR